MCQTPHASNNPTSSILFFYRYVQMKPFKMVIQLPQYTHNLVPGPLQHSLPWSTKFQQISYCKQQMLQKLLNETRIFIFKALTETPESISLISRLFPACGKKKKGLGTRLWEYPLKQSCFVHHELLTWHKNYTGDIDSWVHWVKVWDHCCCWR